MLNTSFLKSSKLSACFGALLFGKEEIGDPLAPLGTPTLKNKISNISREIALEILGMSPYSQAY